jgi:hypothetical protein
MDTPILDTVLLDDVVGGLRKSASSQADLIPLLEKTRDAVKDLERQGKNAGSSSQQMMPLMMLMMMRR